MSHHVRRMHRAKRQPPLITEHALASFWSEDRLPTPQQQADDFLLLVGDSQLAPEAAIRMSLYYVGAWVGTSMLNGPHAGVDFLTEHFAKEGLLDSRPDISQLAEDSVYLFQLTMAGWNRYHELRRKRIDSRTAFMAMKFGDALVSEAVEKSFRPAVSRTGFRLRVLTDQPEAGVIDNHLRAAILGARFVIADLSHGNQGAYWEAGFGEGRGIPVIYTCEISRWNANKTHFDTNHLHTIVWDPTNLKTAEDDLAATIRATLRNEAIQEDAVAQ